MQGSPGHRPASQTRPRELGDGGRTGSLVSFPNPRSVTMMRQMLPARRWPHRFTHLSPSLIPLWVFAQACSSTPSAPGGGGGSGGSDAGNSSDVGSSRGGQAGAGGQGGAGGQAGQGGAGGSSGDGGGDAVATLEGGSATCASLPLCDDFDSDTAGDPPSSSLWSLIGTTGCSGIGSPDAAIQWPILVDKTQFHSAPNSVKISGGDSCGPLMLNTSAFSKLTGTDVYGRFYVFLPATTPVTFDHTTLAGLGLTSPFDITNQSDYLQLASEGAGNPTNVFMWQTQDSDILPDKNSAGGMTSTYPAPSTWTCVEFHTSTSGALETWVNSADVNGLTFIPGTTLATATNNQWMPPSVDGGRFAPTSFGLGWIVFSGPTTNVWFDDVALSSTRIGCD
jgi:hypothetical protein